MSAAVALGACFGLGVWATWLGLRPARPRLDVLLVRLAAPAPAPPSHGAGAGRLAARASERLEELGVDQSHLAADLRISGRTVESLSLRRVLGAGLGLGLALVPGLAVAASGLGVPLGAVLAAAVAAAAVGFVAPVAGLRAEAERRRRSFRYAFSAFLDLCAVALSSGAAVEEALVASATSGRGAAFDEIRQSLDAARRSGASPWAALGRLGAELDLDEVRELGATLALAGTEGARARDSLLAKSTSLRRRRLAEAEASAARRIEAARIPLALQFFAFAALVMAPAMARVATALR